MPYTKQDPQDIIKGYAYGGHNELTLETLMKFGASSAFGNSTAYFLDLLMFATTGYRLKNDIEGFKYLTNTLLTYSSNGRLPKSLYWEIQQRMKIMDSFALPSAAESNPRISSKKRPSSLASSSHNIFTPSPKRSSDEEVIDQNSQEQAHGI